MFRAGQWEGWCAKQVVDNRSHRPVFPVFAEFSTNGPPGDSTSQALSNALIFRSPGSAWLEMIDEWKRGKEQERIPSIRYNCDDKNMTFLLFDGRKAEREADGSFLVTAQEAQYMAANCYRIE